MFKRAFLLLLLTGIVYACMENDEFFSWKKSLPPKVSEAQAWYEKQVGATDLPWKSANSEETNTFRPDWEKAFSNENANYKVTEKDLDKAYENLLKYEDLDW